MGPTDVSRANRYNRKQGLPRSQWAAIERTLGLPVTGDPGSGLARAICRFQRSNKMTADGMVGPETLRALWPITGPARLSDAQFNGYAGRHPAWGGLLRGVDLSHHNDRSDDERDDINFEAVAESDAGGFAIFRASISHSADRMFQTFWRNADGLIPRAAYHFFRFGTPVEAQTLIFRGQIDEAGGFAAEDGGCVVDLEWDWRPDRKGRPFGDQWYGRQPSGREDILEYLSHALTFVEAMERIYQVPCVIYTNYHFWKSVLANSADGVARELANRPLWIASYTPTPPRTMPGAWLDWSIWQYTSGGRVRGIKKPNGEGRDVDINVAKVGAGGFAGIWRRGQC